MTSSETEGIKEETSYEKRPIDKALFQSNEGTMVVDQLVTETNELNRTIEESFDDLNRTIEEGFDRMFAMLTNLMNRKAEQEAQQHQEQQEDTSLTTKAGIEDDKWSAGSEHTSDTEPTYSDERDKTISEIKMIEEGKKGKNEKRINKRIEDCIATICFLDLGASLENPDNHKEKPLTCDMEPDIQRDQQWKLIYNKRKIKNKIVKKRRPDKPILHKPVPLSCDLEPDIGVMKSELISKTKQIICDTRRLVDNKMHSMEPLSCDLEPDIVVMYNNMSKRRK